MREAALRYLVESAVDGPFGSSLTSDHYSDEGTRVVRLGNIGDGFWRDADRAFIPQEYARQLRRHDVRPGDVVVAGLGDANNPLGRSTVVPDIGPAIVKADCFRVRLRPDMLDSRYFVYFMSARGTAIARERAHGSTRQRLPLGEVLDLPVPVPPLAMQRRIADYLDTETARIDALIAKSEHAALLVEERLGRYRHSVLWGRESSPLHDRRAMSSIQYRTVKRTGGRTPSRSHEAHWALGDMGVPWAAIGDLTASNGGEVTATKERVTGDAVKELGMVVVPPGTVLYAMYASLGTVGKAGIALTHNQAILSLHPEPDLLADFLLQWLEFLRPYVQSEARSNTQANLNAEQVGRLPIPAVDIDEQRKMLRRLSSAGQEAQAVGDALGRQQALLRERRQALITAAVTGEIEV